MPSAVSLTFKLEFTAQIRPNGLKQSWALETFEKVLLYPLMPSSPYTVSQLTHLETFQFTPLKSLSSNRASKYHNADRDRNNIKDNFNESWSLEGI